MIPHNIFHLPAKFREFWRFTSRVMNFEVTGLFWEDSTIASIFVEHRLYTSVCILVYVLERVQGCIE